MEIPRRTVFEELPPRLGAGRAEELARQLFGIEARAGDLPSERDRNFLLQEGDGARWVLKVANSAERRAVLEMENAALQHLARRGLPFGLPVPRPDLTGETLVAVRGEDDRPHLARVLSWLPGSFLKDHRPLDADLLRALGRMLGRLDRELADFDHPAAHRAWEWDVRRTELIRARLDQVAAPEDRRRVERITDRCEALLRPLSPRLRSGVIHNDGNDHNVVVDERGGSPAPAGLIDFGDMVHTWTAVEPAVAIHYAVLDTEDPGNTAAEVVSGYAAEHPLRAEEVDALFPLLLLRACASVTMAALRARRFPDNPYLTVSEAPAWRLLRRLGDEDPAAWGSRLRAAAAAGSPP